MFSLLAKVFSLTWDWNHLSTHKVKEKTISSSKAPEKEFFEDSSAFPKEKQFLGTVTNINIVEEYGVVNRAVFFNFEVIYAKKDLTVGDSVLVKAVKKEPHHGWIASYIELSYKPSSVSKLNINSNQPAVSNKNKDCANRSKKFSPSHSDSTKKKGNQSSNLSPNLADLSHTNTKETMPRVEVIEQIVSECNGLSGKLRDGFEFRVEDGETDFDPVIGDVLFATVEYGNRGKIVTSWKPKELKCIEGEITACENACGVINNEIMFFHNSCRLRVRLFVGQKVSAMVALSEQGLFKWRAFSLSTSSNDYDANVDYKPSFSYVDDVSITDPLSFENICLGQENKLLINIENKSSNDLQFHGCHFQNKNGVFYLSKSISPAETIAANNNLIIMIHCKTEAIGQHEDFMIFEFVDFIIKRPVTVTIVDPMQHVLNPTAPFSLKNKRDRKQLDCDDLVIIPGKKPYKPVLHFTNKLPPSNIPRSLTRAVQNRSDLRLVVPWLFDNLTMRNYVKKFSTLLHLEELQVRYDMKKFDLSEVVLDKKGEFLSLEVNGLAEGRPSLIIGDKAILVPPYQNSKFAFEGCIHEVRLNEVLLKFSDSFHSSYTGESFNVRFELNRTNFRRLHQCVHHVSENHDYAIFPTHLKLKPSLMNEFSKTIETHKDRETNNISHPEVDINSLEWKNDKLNWKQKEAVVRILECRSRPLPYIIFGPPGTGKTVTLVEAVLQVFQNIPSSKIIICTPSNSAADLVAHRIIESDMINIADMVRLNSYQRSIDSIPEFIKPFCQDKDSLDYVTQYRIIISTCSTAGALYTIGLCNDFFTHVFIDEAGQLMEPESDIALGFIDSQTEGQVIMAGDPQQLGPVLRSSHSQSCGLQISFLERLMNTALYARNEKKYKQYGGFNPLLVTMLEESYRSHPDILRFPSDLFYFSQIICQFPMNKNYKLMEWDALPTKGFPIIFHGVKGEEYREENSPSWFNPTEVFQVTAYLEKLYAYGLSPDDVGIIAPYKKQVEKIRLFMTMRSLEFCKIGSVEEFQGQERRAIIISTVRSSDQYVDCDKLYNLGFISNPKRLNVAITRSQELLIVVGNPHILSKDFFWHSFVRYCVVNGCYTGCDPPMSFIQQTNIS